MAHPNQHIMNDALKYTDALPSDVYVALALHMMRVVQFIGTLQVAATLQQRAPIPNGTPEALIGDVEAFLKGAQRDTETNID